MPRWLLALDQAARDAETRFNAALGRAPLDPQLYAAVHRPVSIAVVRHDRPRHPVAFGLQARRIDPALAGDGQESRNVATCGAEPGGVLELARGVLEAQSEEVLAGRRHVLDELESNDQVVLRYAPGDMALKPLQPLGASFAREFEAELRAVTGAPWQVTLGDGEADVRILPGQLPQGADLRAAKGMGAG